MTVGGVHVVANVDLSFGNGKAVRVSPDVKAQYVFSDSYVLYAKATGGRQLNDFRRLETYNPYLDPGQEVKDTYEQLNAGLGFKASPTPGLWFDIFGGYQNLKDDLYQSADAGRVETEQTTLVWDRPIRITFTQVSKPAMSTKTYLLFQQAELIIIGMRTLKQPVQNPPIIMKRY